MLVVPAIKVVSCTCKLGQEQHVCTILIKVERISPYPDKDLNVILALIIVKLRAFNPINR